MKKVLMLIAAILGTSVMVNARTEPSKTAPAKEVTTHKHSKTKAEKKEAKAEKKVAKEQKKAAASKTKK
jgi:hypothetical protein